MPTVAFATHQQMPDITDDDHLVAGLLHGSGVEVRPVVWDAMHVDWSRFDCVVIRSTWDYHLKPERYADWLRAFISISGRLWNPPQAVLENLDKRYLSTLAMQGIDVVPTIVQSAGHDAALGEILERSQWDDVVIKPAVSAGGWGTWRASRATANDDKGRFAEQVRRRDVLIQPYMPEIADPGEWSLIFFAGRYSHAVLKKPANGDFRVQRHLGGTTSLAEPGPALIEQAETVLATVEHPLLFARVDGIERQGRFILMELEINEPFLFLGYSDQAAGRFADAILHRLRETGCFMAGDANA